MVLKISQLERKTRRWDLEEMKRDLGYYAQIDTNDREGRQNIFIEGEKLLKIRLEHESAKNRKNELEGLKKKLKLCKKDGNGETIIKNMDCYDILSDLIYERKGVDDSRRVTEAKWLEIKNRVNDCLSHVTNVKIVFKI
jgi:hypothetical protein